MKNVLVTDGDQRAALAITRSLGKQGVRVYVADIISPTISSASKYASGSDVYKSPASKDFLQSIKELVARRDIHIIIPVAEITLFTLLQARDEFPGVVIPFDSYEKISLLSDKAKLVELAQGLDIPCPASISVSDGQDALRHKSKLQFPVVLKPYKSRIYSDGEWISTAVTYASSLRELEQLCRGHPVFSKHAFLLQEYIEGYGQGVFLLFDEGRPIATFCHKRLREKPPTGGMSVLCESVEAPKHMVDASIKLLRHVKWHGVAMVEYKVNERRGPFIMEVNTRFWGSLQLAVDSGVDFPGLLYRQAIGNISEPIAEGYSVHRRLRWLLGDLDRLLLVVKSRDFSAKEKLIEAIKFGAFFSKGQRYEINRVGDMGPFILELKRYVSAVFRRR